LAPKREEKKREMLRMLKLIPELAQCPPFETAATVFAGQRAARDLQPEDQRAVYDAFREWSRPRNCEPGEIIEGDSDWEDMTSLIDRETKRRHLFE
jgi:hypothetical protein